VQNRNNGCSYSDPLRMIAQRTRASANLIGPDCAVVSQITDEEEECRSYDKDEQHSEHDQTRSKQFSKAAA
jgi:hypothetical protein